ncbi:MAG: DUF1330 domain-containing protein [Betaproteobacteria bacterium]|nr:DUF1330 domain-containing protein [Betaproteobacteria bacterium]
MAALCVGHIRVKDAGPWEAYRARVGATIAQYGGELLFRGQWRQNFSGTALGEKVVALRFASLEAARRWHESPEYQALVPLRDAGADVTLELFEE